MSYPLIPLVLANPLSSCLAIICLRLDLFFIRGGKMRRTSRILGWKSVKVRLKRTGEIFPVWISMWTPDIIGCDSPFTFLGEGFIKTSIYLKIIHPYFVFVGPRQQVLTSSLIGRSWRCLKNLWDSLWPLLASSAYPPTRCNSYTAAIRMPWNHKLNWTQVWIIFSRQFL